jgi:hypothetical protein
MSMRGSAIAPAHGMGHVLIPVLILAVVLVGGFIVWEVAFARLARRSIAEQHHDEGRDDPPNTI